MLQRKERKKSNVSGATVTKISKLLMLLFLLLLAKEWPEIIRKWDEIDRAMYNYDTPKNIKIQLKLFGASLTFLTFGNRTELLCPIPCRCELIPVEQLTLIARLVSKGYSFKINELIRFCAERLYQSVLDIIQHNFIIGLFTKVGYKKTCTESN